MNAERTDHHYTITTFEDGIDKGVCLCGAVRFYPVQKAFIARAEQCNHLYAEKGTGVHAWQPAPVEKPKERIKPVVNQDFEAAFPPQNTEKNRVNTAVNASATKDLPPVPLKPAGGGAGKGKSNKLIGDYYLANKAAILSDIEAIGLKPALKHWGISTATWKTPRRGGGWKGLAVRFGTISPDEPANDISRFDKDKDAIIADYYAIPHQLLRKKWGLSANTWVKLRELWQVQPKRPATVAANARLRAKRAGIPARPAAPAAPEPKTAVAKTEPPAAPAAGLRAGETPPARTQETSQITGTQSVRVMLIPHQEIGNGLPRLPDFDPLWPGDVKLEWLRTYKELAGKR